MPEPELLPPLEDPPETPAAAPEPPQDAPVDAAPFGQFQFKPGVYNGRQFDGSLASAAAIFEWSGNKTSIQMMREMNLLRVPTANGQLTCYPGQWVLRLGDDLIVLSDAALNAQMERV